MYRFSFSFLESKKSLKSRRRRETTASFSKTILFPFLLTPGSFSSDNSAVEQPRRGRWSGVDALSWLYIRGVALLAPEAPPGFVGWHAAHRINRDRRTADFYGINEVKTTSACPCGCIRPHANTHLHTHWQPRLYTASTNERVQARSSLEDLRSNFLHSQVNADLFLLKKILRNITLS